MLGKWDIRRVYLYLVSFATLMMMIFGIIQFLQGTVNLVYPSPTSSYPEWEMKFRTAEPGQGPSEEEIKKQVEAEQVRQRYYEVRSMINNLILFLVALPVYVYHWRKIQRTEIQIN